MIGEAALTGIGEALSFWEKAPSDRCRTLAAQMPFDWDYPPQAIRRWGSDPLYDAEPFFVSASVQDLILFAAVSIPPVQLRPELLPTANGWVWFERPFEPEIGIEVSAIHWVLQPMLGGGVGVSLRYYYDDPVACLGLSVIKYGDNLGEQYGSDRAATLRLERIFASFALFIEQDILDAEPKEVLNHSAARRLANEAQRDRAPSIRVVELRRARTDGSSESQSVAWQHHWLVSGHWRKQFYPSTGDYRPIWIAPYTKGDPTKPFKPPSKRLFVVRR